MKKKYLLIGFIITFATFFILGVNLLFQKMIRVCDYIDNYEEDDLDNF